MHNSPAHVSFKEQQQLQCGALVLQQFTANMTAINTRSPLRVTPLPNGYQRSEKAAVSLQLPELQVRCYMYAVYTCTVCAVQDAPQHYVTSVRCFIAVILCYCLWSLKRACA
jgi:hypothetical protein